MNSKEIAELKADAKAWSLYADVYEAGYEQGKKDAAGWISVKDRFPEDDLKTGSLRKQIKVMTAIKSASGVYTIRTQLRMRDYWIKEPEKWVWKYSAGEVTHWKPLPEPPMDAQEGAEG